MAIGTGANRPKDKTIVGGDRRLILEWDAYFQRLDERVSSLISGTAGVTSFEGRVGAIVSVAGDYTASEITNVPAGAIAAITVQAAIDELDSEKQPLSADLTAWDAQFTTSVQGTGLSGIDGNQFFIFNEYTTAPGGADHPAGEIAVMRVQRSANYTGGTAGNVETGLWVPVTVSAGVANYEWAILAQLTNNATAGENVAVYGQAIRASTGPTWASVFEARDNTNTADPSTGLVACEFDMFANGTDASGLRVGIDLILGKHNSGGAACTVGYGLRIGPVLGDGTQGRFSNGIYNYGNFDIGINLSASTCSIADIVTAGNVGFGTSAPDRRLHSEVADAATNTTTQVARLTHATSGTAAASFGVGLEAELENASGTNRVVGTLEWAFTDATNATEDADLFIKLMTAGAAAATVGRFTSTGRLGINVNPAVTFDIASSGGTQMRAVDGATVDLRLNASSASSVGFLGTYTNHDLILVTNGNNTFRIGTGNTVQMPNGTQILSTRVTGWAAATGTKSRATFVTDTALTAAIGARLGQLIDDLITHGLIGA